MGDETTGHSLLGQGHLTWTWDIWSIGYQESPGDQSLVVGSRGLRPHQGMLTQSLQGVVVLQHHIMVERSLMWAQVLPLLLSEVHGHLLKSHNVLEPQVFTAQGPSPLPEGQVHLEAWSAVPAKGLACISHLSTHMFRERAGVQGGWGKGDYGSAEPSKLWALPQSPAPAQLVRGGSQQGRQEQALQAAPTTTLFLEPLGSAGQELQAEDEGPWTAPAP